MTQNKRDIPNIRQYWLGEAQEALDVAEHLFEKRDY